MDSRTNRAGEEPDWRSMETLLCDAALAAGAAIMAIYRGPHAIREKADASPVTAADEAAEAVILDILAKAAPGIPVIAEEAVARGCVPQTGRRFFLVDPLDGTKEFIARNDEFTVNIALIEDHEPVAGIVYAPAIGRLFLGTVGQGAREARVTDARPVAWHDIAVRKPPPEGLTSVASRSHGGPETEAFLSRFPLTGQRLARRLLAGSSLKFCLVATGEADLYPRLGRTMEWDTAAGHAVLCAAGGSVTLMDGARLRYGKRARPDAPDFANPDFIARGAF